MRSFITRILIALFALSLMSGVALAQDEAAKKPAPAAQLLDINSATKAQLDALPAIGAIYSQKIIDGRPYRQKTDLVRMKVLPRNVYAKIQDKIIAKQPTEQKAKKK